MTQNYTAKNHLSVLFNFCFAMLLMACTTGWSQLQIKGDVHIAAGTTMHVAVPNTVFEKGILSTDRSANYGLLSFADHATVSRADHDTHVDGFIRMHNPDGFTYPSGNDNILQQAHIDHLGDATAVDLAFNHVAHTTQNVEQGIELVSDEFYWDVYGTGAAEIALSWNPFSNVDRLTDNDIDRLAIVGFDGSTWRRIDAEIEPTAFHDNSPSSILSGSIRSKNPIYLEGYEALTLARVSGDNSLLVSQGFTPNGDGINDLWFIENVEKYPNATITVYSRWGREIYISRNGYNNNWDGTYQGEVVPDGSYLYVIDLENDGVYDLKGWIYITQ